MRSLVMILLAVAYCEARPNPEMAMVVAGLSPDSYIINGVDANPGEFPWQLSQQRQGAAGAWSHSCGASLLNANSALSAAHCVDGATASILRVLAGLHDRSLPDNAVTSNAASYKMHESYGTGAGSYPNDISIISLVTPIAANGGTIQYAALPADNSNAFAGRAIVISGWGRNSNTNVLPNVLQKTTTTVLTTAECASRMSPVNGATVTDTHICFFDAVNQSGSCNGDSGGPASINYPNADSAARVVAGVTSWGVSSALGNCLTTYPAVYTRTSAYLAWIAQNSA